MDNTILEIQRKLREKGSADVLEGLHLAGQLVELPSSLLSDLLELFTGEFHNFVYTQAMRAISEFRVQDHSVELFLTSSIQNATLKAQNNRSPIASLNSDCLSFALAAAINLDAPGPGLVAAVLAFVKVTTNHENFFLCLEFLNRRQTPAKFHKLIEELREKKSTTKVLQRLFDAVGKTKSELQVLDDDRVFALCKKWQRASPGFQKIIAEISHVGHRPAFLYFKENFTSWDNSSPEKCPNCQADHWKGSFSTAPSVLKCKKCNKFYICSGYYSTNAPGHEEHNRTIYNLKPIGAPGANSRCPCGSGISFSKCCKGT